MPVSPAKHVHVEHVMGTAVTFDVRGERPECDAVAAAVALLRDVDAEFSTYRHDSAVCRFDRGELVRAAVSDELAWVIERCSATRSTRRRSPPSSRPRTWPALSESAGAAHAPRARRADP